MTERVTESVTEGVAVETPGPDFAAVLKLLREDAWLTQEELAEASGLSVRTISDLERGVSKTARKATAGLLADHLGLSGAIRDQFLAAARGVAPAGSVATAALPGVRYSLPPDTAAFTGRDAELDLVTAGVRGAGGAGGAGAIQAIDGMPGVGKTALAVHLAHLLRDQFPDRQMFVDLQGYTPGREPLSPRDALAGLLAAVGVDPRFLPADLHGLAGMWRDRMAGQRALLVLDNAAASSQVLPLLPGGETCLVLVTSRRHLGDLPGLVAPVLLDALSPRQAGEMFTRLAPRAVGSPAQVAEVADLAGRLPLAISLLARVYSRHSSWTLADLIAETRAGLLTLKAENESVAAAFEVSYRHLDHARQRLFRLIGGQPGTTIDAFAAAALAGASLAEATALLDSLHGEGLLTETGYRRYGLHDLLRRYARELAADGPAADSQPALQRLLDYYQHTAARAGARLGRQTQHAPAPVAAPPVAVPDLATSSRATRWLRAERVNLLACLDWAAESGQQGRVAALTAVLSTLLRQDGPWADGLTRHAAAVRAARQCGDRLGQAHALNELGVLQHLTGDLSGSRQTLEEALDIYRDLGDRLGQANALHGLGVVQRYTGEYRDAVRALEEALDMYRVLGDELGQANALLELGACRRRLAGIDYRAALEPLQEALGIYRELGNKHGQANALSFLGYVQQLTGNYPGAIRAQRQALAIYRDLGNTHGQANALNFLGIVWQRTGDYADATEALEEALSVYRGLGYRMGQANALKNLGVVRRVAGDYEAAAQALQTALPIYRDIGDRGGEVEALNEAGALHLTRGDPAAARACHLQALELAREIDSSWDEAHALAGLGRSALATGRRDEGTSSLRDAHEIFQRINAAEAPAIAAELEALTEGNDLSGST